MRAATLSHLSAAAAGRGIAPKASTSAAGARTVPTSTPTLAAPRSNLPSRPHGNRQFRCAAGAPSQPGRKREEGSEAEALRAAAEASVDAPAKDGDGASSSSGSGNGEGSGAATTSSDASSAAAREQQAARAASSGSDTPGGDLSSADLARLAAARAAEASGKGAAPGAVGSGGFLGDVLQEARLIEWPSLKQALGDTVLVVGIVLGSAVLLFAVNTLLADLSKAIY